MKAALQSPKYFKSTPWDKLATPSIKDKISFPTGGHYGGFPLNTVRSAACWPSSILCVMLTSSLYVFQSEVGVFPMEWLTPAILIYTKKDYDKPLNTDGML